MIPEAAEYLSAQDIATITGVHVATVWAWAKQPGFPVAYRFGSRATRWKRAEFQAWAEEKRSSG
ncbi:AlpA family transcriptional regulator [Ancylobacter aquaticus]|uniref:AlpA family transcriptional regulator n=1 Tax=Ancylobacter aquaticus TaxID=100 RepID=A0A4R1I5U7_ANCAQ|nr:AlpA family transcriptional regulator [Ancylobacter aquaticus]